MITAQEIKTKSQRKYAEYLRSLLSGQSIFPLRIPSNKDYNKSSFEESRKEISDIVGNSKEKKGFGYTVEYKKVRTKSLGDQDLPAHIFFEHEYDFIKYLSKVDEVKTFQINCEKIIQQLPELKAWLIQNPMKVIEYAHDFDSLLKVCHYFKANPQPNLYIRELPIQVHTKFIEQNTGILRSLLDFLIPEYCDPTASEFNQHFHLKSYESQIRFRILDPKLSTNYFSGVSDLDIPVSQFQKLNLPLKRVIVVENKTIYYTVLTLPNIASTIVIFGSGYKVSDLKQVSWLNNVELWYWGDIDAQGFEILSQLRGYFPHTTSFLMDQSTFDTYFEKDSGTPSNTSSTLQLTGQEQQLYELVQLNNWRLEQEKIPYEYVNQVISSFLLISDTPSSTHDAP
ncbi:MAG: DUF2399 domain-containing protein [Gammaproteobacteria bacterium]|nr:DUF2399 domain-containing protein [Gammaproteobacteria bacterium]